MKISTKGRYALRAMISIAQNGGAGNVKAISEEQGLSAKYLEALFSKLSRNNIVKGKRGPSGGYVLATPAKDISCYDILNAMGDELVIVDCLKDVGHRCKRKASCPTRPLWLKLDETVTKFLKSVSLADMANGKVWE